MSLTTAQIAFLQRLVADQPSFRRSSETASFLATEFGIGVASGRQVIYQVQDWEAAGQLLDNREIPREAPSGSVRRAETSQYGGMSEKIYGEYPHANSIAVRVASGDCRLTGAPIATPDGSYLAVRANTALAIQCDRILVVENLETFRDLSGQRWIDYQGQSTLALYRGDKLFNIGEAARVIMERTEPVWAFFDFDPAGLGLATALPHLERLLLPDPAWLRDKVYQAKRFDLFDNQVGQYENTLDRATHPDIQSAWTMMKELRRGLPQEWMESAGN